NGLQVSSNSSVQANTSGNNVVTLNTIVTNFGTVEISGRMTCSNTFLNLGTLIIGSGATANFYAPVTNTGLIVTNSSTVNFYAGVTGTGNMPSAAEDDDHDGVSNLDEARAGTDPLDPTSFFHIAAAWRQGDDLLLQIRCGAGRANQLEFSPAPTGPYTN